MRYHVGQEAPVDKLADDEREYFLKHGRCPKCREGSFLVKVGIANCVPCGNQIKLPETQKTPLSEF